MTTNSERNFYTGITLAIAVCVFVGFARTFFLRPLFPEAAEIAAPERFFYYHGVVFTAWIVLIVVQAWLIRSRNVALHRTLGTAGLGLAVILVVVGIYGALLAANRPGGFIGIPMEPDAFLIVPFLDMVFFGLLVGLAAHWRKPAASAQAADGPGDTQHLAGRLCKNLATVPRRVCRAHHADAASRSCSSRR